MEPWTLNWYMLAWRINKGGYSIADVYLVRNIGSRGIIYHIKTDCLMYMIISGSNVQCKWYFLLAQIACAAVCPLLYTEINHANQFANLIKVRE